MPSLILAPLFPYLCLLHLFFFPICLRHLMRWRIGGVAYRLMQEAKKMTLYPSTCVLVSIFISLSVDW